MKKKQIIIEVTTKLVLEVDAEQVDETDFVEAGDDFMCDIDYSFAPSDYHAKECGVSVNNELTEITTWNVQKLIEK